VSDHSKGVPLPRSVALALREFVNALGKATMYPAGHRFVTDAATAMAARLADVVQERGGLTIGILPRGMLLDGAAIDPLPPILREFAARLHRKNIGTIHVAAGSGAPEVAAMLAALAASDADETVGRQGWRGHAIRVEPLVYDVLGFGDDVFDQELDDAFWGQLVEAAFGRRLSDTEGIPTPAQVAEALTERTAKGPEEGRRVFQALASFSSAIAARGERGTGGARRRFTEVLAALSRPTQVRVIEGASSAMVRRRFLAETLEIVPTALMLQLLEAVAEADGEPISPQLRWLLGKLAVGPDGSTTATPAFTAQVLSIVDDWEGHEEPEVAGRSDPRISVEPARTVALGLELGVVAPLVTAAAVAMADRGQLAEVLQLLDAPGNHRGVADALTAAVLDPGLLERLLADPTPDFALIERVVLLTRASAVPILLAALEKAESRSARRRLLDLLVRLGPMVETLLVSRLDGAPWFLSRNILIVLAQLEDLRDPEPVQRALRHEDVRVRQEALKVLLRHPATRDRAIGEAVEGGDEVQTRVALAALGGQCPPNLVAPVLSVLGHPNADLRLQAVRLLADSTSPLVVPQLLTLVRSRGGFLRRVRLLPTTPVMLAALEVLSRRWRNHRPVVAVLQLAARSSDPAVQAIVQGGA
jgi:hypothetical protein